MTKRKGIHSHYELMFEEYLRSKQILYLATNEAKRPIFKDDKIKNFDFIAISKSKQVLLIDIKGKQFPYESKRGKNYWENWIGLDDVKSLKLWSENMNAVGLIVYPYLIKYTEDKKYFIDSYQFNDSLYGIVSIEVKEYENNSKPRSKSGKGTFNAISVSRSEFANLVKPISNYLY